MSGETSGIVARIAMATERINSAIERHNPIAVFGLYSGGHDSFSACYCASMANRFDGCAHFHTGIGIEATRDHVRETCTDRGWPLHEYKAMENAKADGTPDPMDYEAMVLKDGFPGPAAHRFMYIKLKERSVKRFERDQKATTKRPILFISGARMQESERRMGTASQVENKMGRAVWINAIIDWSKLDTTLLIDHVGAKRNPVYDLIHKSGECLCGAFAKPGELAELKMWPQTRPAYDRIIALQAKVKAAGFPWGWEEKPPEWWNDKKRGQSMMFEDMPLCWSCSKHKEAA